MELQNKFEEVLNFNIKIKGDLAIAIAENKTSITDNIEINKLNIAKQCTILCLEEKIKLLESAYNLINLPSLYTAYDKLQNLYTVYNKLQNQLKLLKDE